MIEKNARARVDSFGTKNPTCRDELAFLPGEDSGEGAKVRGALRGRRKVVISDCHKRNVPDVTGQRNYPVIKESM